MDYRSEIDGLRAVAVIPVILFHAGFEAFGGGFVGVDIFFVISGYLITTIILSDMNNGKFSIVTFYERRARRILPALFFVLLCCLPFAWYWLVPLNLEEFSKSVKYVSIYLSNFLFLRESGYFQTSSELKPLLHTWSLAVEEQYYILFPPFLMLLWKLRKRWLFGSIVFIGVLSLLYAQWGAYNRPDATFFLLPTRIWEIAIGALIAFYFLYRREQVKFLLSNKSLCNFFSFFGFALIVYSILVFDKSTPFPSFYALIPTIGTALIIVFSSSSTLVGHFLSTKVMVGVGLISYSAYLWHQPIFVFARHRSLGNLSDATCIALSIASLIVAYFSWRYIEHPFRNKKTFSRKRIFLFSALGTLFFVVIGTVGYKYNGFPDRFQVSESLTNSFQRSERSADCFDKKNASASDDWYCEIGNADQPPSFFVFGDSHAVSLLDVFDSSSNSAEMSGLFAGKSSCPPFIGVYTLGKNSDEKQCYELNMRVYNYVKEHEIKDIFLIGRWTYYTDGDYDGRKMAYLGTSPNDKRDISISRNAFRVGLEKTIEYYKKINTNIFIISQVPQQRFNADKIYQRLSFFEGADEKLNALDNMAITYADHKDLNGYVDSVFEASMKNDNYSLISFDNLLCDSDVCKVGTPDQSFYFDDDHLSIVGADRLKGKLENVLRVINSGP